MFNKIIPALFLILIFSSCAKSPVQENNPPRELSLDSAIVQIRNFNKTVTGLGQVQAIQSTQLIAEYPGNFQPNHLNNNRYSKGEILYRLTGETVAHQSSLLQSDVETNRADSIFYSKEFLRQQVLYEKEMISPQQWNQIQRQYEIVRAKLKNAESTLDYFKRMTTYRAPFDGTISQVQYPEGDYITANSRIGYFWNPDSMKLVIPWNDRDVNLNKDQHVTLTLADSLVLNGDVIFIDSSIDPGSGARDVWIRLDSAPPVLFPGERLPYSVTIDSVKSPVVPENALIRDQHQYWVMVADHGKYYPINVQLIKSENGWTAISGNIRTGDNVLTKGAYEIYHKQSTLQYQVQD